MSIGKNLQVADYIEDHVALAIQSMISAMSFPFRRFSIELFSKSHERNSGADARLHGAIRNIRPFHMQFKRPSAYPAKSRSHIITDRIKLGAGCSPHAFFFDLRKKKDTHHDFQHNVLYGIRKDLLAADAGDAAYVCPLYLDLATYQSAAHRSGSHLWPALWRRHPWRLKDTTISSSSGQVKFERIPFLADHITIPPHTLVTTANHRYSFTPLGDEICFHEPTRLPEGPQTLGKFLNGIGNRFLRDGGRLTPENSMSLLNQLERTVYGDGEILERLEDQPIARWMDFGFRLQRDFRIAQYAFVEWNQDF